MDPKSDEWDVLRAIESDCCLAKDSLLRRPSPNHTYIDSKGRIKDPHKYSAQKKESKMSPHPKLQAHIDNGTATPGLYTYYEGMPHDHNLPLAGFTRERKFGTVFRDHVLTCTVYQEDAFHARPSIKLAIPDHLKAILVDDWENVTKNQQLVPLPSAHPVNSILADYLTFEKPKRIPGSAQADILEEIVAGLKEYFEKCLGRILLYR
jgi:MRG